MVIHVFEHFGEHFCMQPFDEHFSKFFCNLSYDEHFRSPQVPKTPCYWATSP